MSRSTFSRRIKEVSDVKAIDFIKKAKLKFAAQLLLNGELSIKEIAWKVGYSDTKYFSRQFQQEFNCLPSKFKEEFNL